MFWVKLNNLSGGFHPDIYGNGADVQMCNMETTLAVTSVMCVEGKRDGDAAVT